MKRNGPKMILIADDDESMKDLLRTLCEEWGYQTVLAADGREAVSLARAHLPELIIMDAAMPVLDGFEATKILKADPETNGIPVVMLTGLIREEDRMKGLACGASEYLTKPVSKKIFAYGVLNNIKNEGAENECR